MCGKVTTTYCTFTTVLCIELLYAQCMYSTLRQNCALNYCTYNVRTIHLRQYCEVQYIQCSYSTYNVRTVHLRQ